MAIYDPKDDLMQDQRTIQIVVSITVRGDADISELISEMNYQFTHDAIIDTEICDVFTEN